MSNNPPCCFFCGREEKDLERCSLCTNVLGCSLHLAIHQPQGTKLCLPFTVESRPGIGRVLVASRDIPQGDIAIYDEALVLAPENGTVCCACVANIEDDPHWCSRCAAPLCGDCQSSPGDHEAECEILERLHLTPDHFKRPFLCTCIGVLKLLLAAKQSIAVSEVVTDLMGHEVERLNDPIQRELLYGIFKVVGEKCHLDWVTQELVAHAYGVLQTNAIGYRDEKAFALYSTISLMSHSCSPNLDRLAQFGKRFGFKAQRAIMQGEELTIRYTRTLDHRLNLREFLRSKWHFNCECPRCRDPTDLGSFVSSPLCKTCREPVVPIDALDLGSPWLCEKKCAAVQAGDVLKMDTIAKDLLSKVDRTDAKVVGEAVATLEKAFHRNYHHIVKLKFDFMIDGKVDESNEEALMLKKGFCLDIIHVLNLLDEGKTRLLQNMTTHLTKVRMKLLKLEKTRAGSELSQRDYLTKMKMILAQSCGRSSPGSGVGEVLWNRRELQGADGRIRSMVRTVDVRPMVLGRWFGMDESSREWGRSSPGSGVREMVPSGTRAPGWDRSSPDNGVEEVVWNG
eukprot:maker-scaffold1031_size68893-snap-gene-0.21 protein:Tk04000 transcript:maker-scaffold1031_size68893-snap-gene-0.21-mRNA-1 annotation:"protein isoform a"